MQVQLFATLRIVAGRGELPVEVSASDTVGDLIERLSRDYPGLGERILGPDGRLRSSINVLLNGRDIRHLDGLDTPLHGDDRVALFPAVGGG